MFKLECLGKLIKKTFILISHCKTKAKSINSGSHTPDIIIPQDQGTIAIDYPQHLHNIEQSYYWLDKIQLDYISEAVL